MLIEVRGERMESRGRGQGFRRVHLLICVLARHSCSDLVFIPFKAGFIPRMC